MASATDLEKVSKSFENHREALGLLKKPLFSPLFCHKTRPYVKMNHGPRQTLLESDDFKNRGIRYTRFITLLWLIIIKF